MSRNQIAKEYCEDTTEFSSGVEVTGTRCFLRYTAPRAPMTLRQIARLFNEAAKDFPRLTENKMDFRLGRIEIQSKPPTSAYQKIAGKHVTHDELLARLRQK